MGLGKWIGRVGGALAGGAVGGPVGAIAGGIAGGAIAGGGIDFDDALIGGFTGFALSDIDLGIDIFGGSFGGSVATPATAGGAASSAGALTAATGATAKPGGLLSRTLASDWWKSPAAGYVLAGVGQEVLRGDPAVEAGRIRRRQHAADREHYRKMYEGRV